MALDGVTSFGRWKDVKNACKRLRNSPTFGGISSVQWRKVGGSWRLKICFHRLLRVQIEIEQLYCVNCCVSRTNTLCALQLSYGSPACLAAALRTPENTQKLHEKWTCRILSFWRCGSRAILFFVGQPCGVVNSTLRLSCETQKFVVADRRTAAVRLMWNRLLETLENLRAFIRDVRYLSKD